jgi:hypothetical protein
MMYGKTVVRMIEKRLPGLTAQYAYHGCHLASVQVFRGDALMLDYACRCEEWGHGRLHVKLSALVRQCEVKQQA